MINMTNSTWTKIHGCQIGLWSTYLNLPMFKCGLSRLKTSFKSALDVDNCLVAKSRLHKLPLAKLFLPAKVNRSARWQIRVILKDVWTFTGNVNFVAQFDCLQNFVYKTERSLPQNRIYLHSIRLFCVSAL
mgnify:CR=1 FL=1